MYVVEEYISVNTYLHWRTREEKERHNRTVEGERKRERRRKATERKRGVKRRERVRVKGRERERRGERERGKYRGKTIGLRHRMHAHTSSHV